MWYAPTTTAAPDAEPITLDQAKAQCRVTDTASDTLFNLFIPAERAFVEKYCNIRIVEQTITIKCDGFSDFARVPIGPVQEISAIAYVDTDGNAATLDPSVYEVRVDGLECAIVTQYGQVFPVPQVGSRIAVTVVVGYADDAIPPEIVSALLLRVSADYQMSKADPFLRRDQIEGVGLQEWDYSGKTENAMATAVAALLENFRCWAQ